ncbi:male sterility protein-domain-containing protein [Xylaria venustula]|nr:male sterility protein-domain-containing protein [Xylaria venustula]
MWSISGQEELDEFRTRDLFEPHPTVADAWCWRARTDDIIVFLNGEKTSPVTMEQNVVAGSSELTGAIVVGSQRFQTALLVEPASTVIITTTADQAALIERIWPIIEEANSIDPAHARVEKSMVIVATPDRPLIHAAKGTIQRAVSLAQYSAELDKLYSDADTQTDMANEIYSPMSTDMLTRLIRDTVVETTGWLDIRDSAGFFENGMDSLQALQIIRSLRRSLGASYLALSTLYRNASIARLSTAILTHKSSEDDDDLMQSLLSTYSGLLKEIKLAGADAADASGTSTAATGVILTGSTGSLGTYILGALLNRPGIGHIFCLNRGPDGGRAVQNTRFKAAGLAGDGLDDRPFLGLDEANHHALQSRAGFIIHNAWPLAGLVNLFALSSTAAAMGGKNMKFLFVSSVGAVIDGRPGPAPEALVELQQHGGSNGYSISKLIAEHLCDCAARHLETPVLVAGVGRVAGAIKHKGMWNPAEWLPSLVISSQNLRCLPNSLGPRFSAIDWMPADAVADVVVDLVTYPSKGDEAMEEGAQVFNIRNPAVVSWETLLPAIQDGIKAGPGRAVEVVAPEMWLSRLEQSAENAMADDGADAAAKANPAMKLVEFYRNRVWNGSPRPTSTATTSQAPMTIEKTPKTSPALRDLPPVSLDWMRKWVDEWFASVAAQDS